MIKPILISFVVFSLVGCQTTRYIERTSQPLSQTTWATFDSIENGRIDLAEYYSSQTLKLVPAPKNRIVINPVYTEDNKEIKRSQ